MERKREQQTEMTEDEQESINNNNNYLTALIKDYNTLETRYYINEKLLKILKNNHKKIVKLSIHDEYYDKKYLNNKQKSKTQMHKINNLLIQYNLSNPTSPKSIKELTQTNSYDKLMAENEIIQNSLNKNIEKIMNIRIESKIKE
jgi:hypothetical protein